MKPPLVQPRRSRDERAAAVRLVLEHGPREAERRTGIPKSTLSRWAEAEPGRTGTDGPAREGSRSASEAEKDGVEGSATHAPTASRARARETPSIGELLTPDALAQLRTCVDQQLGYLADPKTLTNQRGRLEAARALRDVLTMVPDIMSFDKTTGAKSDELDNATLRRLLWSGGAPMPDGQEPYDPMREG